MLEAPNGIQNSCKKSLFGNVLIWAASLIPLITELTF